jgi:hypothetical protein
VRRVQKNQLLVNEKQKKDSEEIGIEEILPMVQKTHTS